MPVLSGGSGTTGLRVVKVKLLESTLTALVVEDGGIEYAYLIGVEVASLLKRQTFNMYRSMKSCGIQLQRASHFFLAFLVEHEAVPKNTHSVTLVPYKDAVLYVAKCKKLATKDVCKSSSPVSEAPKQQQVPPAPSQQPTAWPTRVALVPPPVPMHGQPVYAQPGYVPQYSAPNWSFPPQQAPPQQWRPQSGVAPHNMAMPFPVPQQPAFTIQRAQGMPQMHMPQPQPMQPALPRSGTPMFNPFIGTANRDPLRRSPSAPEGVTLHDMATQPMPAGMSARPMYHQGSSSFSQGDAEMKAGDAGQFASPNSSSYSALLQLHANRWPAAAQSASASSTPTSSSSPAPRPPRAPMTAPLDLPVGYPPNNRNLESQRLLHSLTLAVDPQSRGRAAHADPMRTLRDVHSPMSNSRSTSPSPFLSPASASPADGLSPMAMSPSDYPASQQPSCYSSPVVIPSLSDMQRIPFGFGRTTADGSLHADKKRKLRDEAEQRPLPSIHVRGSMASLSEFNSDGSDSECSNQDNNFDAPRGVTLRPVDRCGR